ncbi:hypothetical protein [Pedobacter kyonggii]|uniref:Tox-MPTase3 domain-containing protein n=1 Tax=Pedobacter kyonggii TaxID=1926871 RepID=A0A4Q9HGQ6_9SPHI|nr:hypothetical protein [Pedobacter kyonggii]TBO44454.1 hypothetical protein EYS08_03875 [Pedobacter kyonggii]
MGDGKVIINKKTGANVLFSSLNYLLMYKDSLQNIHAEWVYLQPDSLWFYGDRRKYTGSIWVRNWNGTFIKKNDYPSNQIESKSNILQGKILSSITPIPKSSSSNAIVTPFCVDLITRDRENSKCNCTPSMLIINNGCDNCPAYCARVKTTTICVWPTPDCVLCKDVPATGPGSNGNSGTVGGQGNGGGGSPTAPGDLTPDCNPAPDHNPNIVYPDGSMPLPRCDGIIVIDEPGALPPVPISSANLLINLLNITDLQKVNRLNLDPEVSGTLLDYLYNFGETNDNKDFANWALDYLLENPEVHIAELIETQTLLNNNIILPTLDISALNNHPKFKALVNDLPNFLTQYPNVLKALSLTTGMKESKIMALMQPGKGPKVVVINNLQDGNGHPVAGQFDDVNKILKIDQAYVEDLDKASTPLKYQAVGLILTITTLHEFVHFGRDANNLPKRMAGLISGKGSFEAGWYFEDIIVAPGSHRIEPANAAEWLKYYRILQRK